MEILPSSEVIPSQVDRWESVSLQLTSLCHTKNTIGVALFNASECFGSTLPFSDEKLEALVSWINQMYIGYEQSGRVVDQISFSFEEMTVLSHRYGSWRLTFLLEENSSIDEVSANAIEFFAERAEEYANIDNIGLSEEFSVVQKSGEHENVQEILISTEKMTTILVDFLKRIMPKAHCQKSIDIVLLKYKENMIGSSYSLKDAVKIGKEVISEIPNKKVQKSIYAEFKEVMSDLQK